MPVRSAKQSAKTCASVLETVPQNKLAAEDLHPVRIVFALKVPWLCEEKQLENGQANGQSILS